MRSLVNTPIRTTHTSIQAACTSRPQPIAFRAFLATRETRSAAIERACCFLDQRAVDRVAFAVRSTVSTNNSAGGGGTEREVRRVGLAALATVVPADGAHGASAACAGPFAAVFVELSMRHDDSFSSVGCIAGGDVEEGEKKKKKSRGLEVSVEGYIVA